jgi:hypothetical protein
MKIQKMTVYLPDDLAKSLRIACVNHETTLSCVFTDLVASYITKPFRPSTRDRRKTRKRNGVAI